MTSLFTKIWEIRYRDTDPDSGLQSSGGLVCACFSESSAAATLAAIEKDYMEVESNPNREFFIDPVEFYDTYQYEPNISFKIQEEVFQFFGKRAESIKYVGAVDLEESVKVTMIIDNIEALGPYGDLYDRLNLFLSNIYKKPVYILVKRG